MTMIEFDKPKSIPNEILKPIHDFITLLPSDTTSKIQCHPIRYDTDVRCAIEKDMSPSCPSTWDFYKSMIATLNHYSIKCYHATKVIKVHCIEKEGLLVNDWERYASRLKNTMYLLGVEMEKADRALELIQAERSRKYIDHTPQLCFFSCINQMESDDNSAAYDQFCESIGGELARWCLAKAMPDVYQILKKHGKQVLVTFELPFLQNADYNKECIAYHLVCYYAAKHYWNYPYKMEFDSSTKYDVPPNRILSVQIHPKAIDYT